MTEQHSRHAHLHPAALSAVFVGGALGTTTRWLLSMAFPAGSGSSTAGSGTFPVDFSGFPATTFWINVTGSFLLGLLVVALPLLPGSGESKHLARLLLGTGFIGGFTTYSAFAVESVALVRDGATGLAVLYAGGSVLVGFAAAFAVMSAVKRITRGSL